MAMTKEQMVNALYQINQQLGTLMMKTGAELKGISDMIAAVQNEVLREESPQPADPAPPTGRNKNKNKN